jgi:hypothetical protein
MSKIKFKILLTNSLVLLIHHRRKAKLFIQQVKTLGTQFRMEEITFNLPYLSKLFKIIRLRVQIIDSTRI